MFINDTTNTGNMTTGGADSASFPVKDSVFIPVYIKKNPSDTERQSADDINCGQYINSVLKESSYIQQQRPTMFKEKITDSPNIVMQTNNIQTNGDWIFYTVVGIILLIAIMTRFAGNILYSFLSGCFSKNILNITTKDGAVLHPLALIPVMFIFLPAVSFISYVAVCYYDLTDIVLSYLPSSFIVLKTDYLLFLSIYGLLILCSFVKVLFIEIFGWLFKGKTMSNTYVQLHFNFEILTGLLLVLPMIFTLYTNFMYKEIFLFIDLGILVILYVMKIARTIILMINMFKFSYIYLFFYLCTLELLPVIIVVKFLLG